jgi:hypothetical protein
MSACQSGRKTTRGEVVDMFPRISILDGHISRMDISKKQSQDIKVIVACHVETVTFHVLLRSKRAVKSNAMYKENGSIHA